jgi:hypothetical protein
MTLPERSDLHLEKSNAIIALNLRVHQHALSGLLKRRKQGLLPMMQAYVWDAVIA